MLYPDFMGYMMHVFGAQWLVYASLFFLESFFLYTYYYGWDAFRYGNKKWLHLTLGLLLNGAGMTIMVLANSWATFMMAPSGVNEVGAVIGTIWEVMKGPLWNPINLHRFIANIGFGGAVVGAYAAFKFLSSVIRSNGHIMTGWAIPPTLSPFSPSCRCPLQVTC